MIYVYVNSKRMEYVCELLDAIKLKNQLQLKEDDVLVLPVVEKNTRVLILEEGVLSIDTLHDLKIMIPNTNNYLNENNDVYYYMREDEVVIGNAKLTALGMLSYILSFPYFYKDIIVDVIGYGRCGKEIYSLFTSLGIKTRVIRHINDPDFIDMKEYRDMKKGDIIVNTSPCCKIKREDINGECTIIDISSEKCFSKQWEDEELKIIYPGSLPDQYAPYSSAMLISNYIRRMIYER